MKASQGKPLSQTKTKVTTPVIPYSQLLAGDEEEKILHWAETLNTSPTTPDKVQQLKKGILDIAEMKASLLLMTKAESNPTLHPHPLPRPKLHHELPHLLQ